jgi:hypothetical protein
MTGGQKWLLASAVVVLLGAALRRLRRVADPDAAAYGNPRGRG